MEEMSKDLITKLIISDGRELEVCMPTMEDMEEVFGAGNADHLPYLMASKAVGMSMDEFRTLSMVDGVRIINAVGPAMEAMTDYLRDSTSDILDIVNKGIEGQEDA